MSVVAEAATKTDLYNELLTIMSKYLGPAGGRFLDRQIEFHLNKKPIEVTVGDIDKLKEWVKVSLALLTADKELVDKCMAEFELVKD